jgi:hypothetical protein
VVQFSVIVVHCLVLLVLACLFALAGMLLLLVCLVFLELLNILLALALPVILLPLQLLVKGSDHVLPDGFRPLLLLLLRFESDLQLVNGLYFILSPVGHADLVLLGHLLLLQVLLELIPLVPFALLLSQPYYILIVLAVLFAFSLASGVFARQLLVKLPL